MNTQTVTVNVATAGMLALLIDPLKQPQMSRLKITGVLNGTDIRFLRELLGSGVHGYATSGSLGSLDLSEARFIEGGFYYYASSLSRYFYSRENEISDNMFFGCTSLSSIILPCHLSSIGERAFWECRNLNEIHCASETPPALKPGWFWSVGYSTCKLYVPSGTLEVYRSAPLWGNFENVAEKPVMEMASLNNI